MSLCEKQLLGREEFLWDKDSKDFYEKAKLKEMGLWEFTFKRLVKENELGHNILPMIIDECGFDQIEESENFRDLFLNWYNNSPQYLLGGYSPNELKKKYMSK